MSYAGIPSLTVRRAREMVTPLRAGGFPGRSHQLKKDFLKQKFAKPEGLSIEVGWNSIVREER
jgi:hypothetical protein